MEKFEQILVTEEYLRKVFADSDNFSSEAEKQNKIDSLVRTANIGRTIAKAEGINEDAVAIGCLLLDISYAVPFTDNDYKNHGRDSAVIARSFLKELGIGMEYIESICYAIAKHVDGNAGFNGDDNYLTDAILSADMIEKFSSVKLFENLDVVDFYNLSLENKLEIISNMLEKLRNEEERVFITNTAKNLWMDNIGFQEVFYRNLQKQLLAGKEITE